MPLMFVKPREGFKIVDRVKGDHLPPAGRYVDANDFYWHRLLRDGDVVAAEAPAEKKADVIPTKTPAEKTADA